MVRVVVAAGLCAALTACGLVRSDQVSGMEPAALQAVSDRDLCNPWVESRPHVVAERRRRDLGDCTVAHRQCVQSGFPAGSPGYLECRRLAVQADTAQRAAYGQMMATGAQIMQSTQPRAPMTCTTVGNVTTCQ